MYNALLCINLLHIFFKFERYVWPEGDFIRKVSSDTSCRPKYCFLFVPGFICTGHLNLNSDYIRGGVVLPSPFSM